MTTFKYLYFSIILLVIIAILYYYIDSINEYEKEMKRIAILEKNHNIKKYHITQARLNSTKCDLPELNNPRQCYIDSNYRCKWSIDANRCNKII